jgi:methionine-rich copper-binding protein CopC
VRAATIGGALSALALLALAPATRGLADGRTGHDAAVVDELAAARHLKLLKSEPAANATLAAPPTTVKLWFSQRPELAVTRVTIKGATGAERVLAPLARGEAGDAPITGEVGIALPPGAYTIAWRTMAKDGHVLSGTVPFRIASAPARAR